MNLHALTEHQVDQKTGILRRWLPSRGTVLFTFLLLASLFFAGRAGAIPGLAPAGPTGASSNLIAYQGRLTDATGVPLTGSYAMIFALYDVPTGGAALWSESRIVAATDGVFSVMLGEVTPIPASIAANTSLYLGAAIGSDSEMTPRKQLGSVAYAFQALTVADGAISAAKLADGAVTQVKLAPDLTVPMNPKVIAYINKQNNIEISAPPSGAVTTIETINFYLAATPAGYRWTSRGTSTSVTGP